MKGHALVLDLGRQMRTGPALWMGIERGWGEYKIAEISKNTIFNDFDVS